MDERTGEGDVSRRGRVATLDTGSDGTGGPREQTRRAGGGRRARWAGGFPLERNSENVEEDDEGGCSQGNSGWRRLASPCTQCLH